MGKAKRKRGRPTKTGDFVKLAEAKERLNEAKEREVDILFMKMVPQGKVDPTEWVLLDDDKLAADYKYQPTAEIGAKLLRQLEAVGLVASKPKNLKGTMQKVLKTVHQIGRIAMAELTARIEGFSPALFRASSGRGGSRR